MSQNSFIYVACPLSPMGGGMFKVTEYLVQSQADDFLDGFAQLRALDTRGPGNAIISLFFVSVALIKIIAGKISGKLVGVHVNMAERLSLFRKGIIVFLCRILHIPVVLHLHAAQLPNCYYSLPKLFKLLTRHIFSSSATCLVLGQTSMKFLIDELKIDPKKVVILNNGVPDLSVFNSSREDNKVFRLLFLGNLSERKGVSDLLRALPQVKYECGQMLVTIAGGGDVIHYQELAQQLGVDDIVKFTGWVDQKKAAELLADADTLILPSYDEGLPLVILEALSASVPVICTPVGEIPTVLTDKFNACFVTPGDSTSIAIGIINLIRNPDLRLKLRNNGRDIYLREFAMARFFENIAVIHKKQFGICAKASSSLISQ
ncbi:MAG: glycosyl transferase family 1 [Methylomonas sp.]|nr:MAG: glycosyl transferase family 1 [Methylomonas sp.]